MPFNKTESSQQECIALKGNISELLKNLATAEKKNASAFLEHSSLNTSQRLCLEKLLARYEALFQIKENFITLSNRLLRLVLTQAGALPSSENMDEAACKGQEKLEAAVKTFESTQLSALLKGFLQKQNHLEQQVLVASEEVQLFKKNLKELESPETFYQKIADTFAAVTQDQKKQEDHSQTILKVASNLLEQEQTTSHQFFITPDELKAWSSFGHFLERLHQFQKIEELFADIANSLVEEAFVQGELIKEVKTNPPTIIASLREQIAATQNTDLTNLTEQFLEAIQKVSLP